MTIGFQRRRSAVWSPARRTLRRRTVGARQVVTFLQVVLPADLPLDILEKIGPLEGPVQEARDLHDNTIGSVYDTIRDVNQKVGEFAAEILEKLEKQ